ncbi:MAG TPA: SusC/RagA family TonB-linked outer membrane protein [Parafilimonas sp.]|nr:SusC/RagA family TonB-linked outer membrane protein [Parafilimonas sp.]
MKYLFTRTCSLVVPLLFCSVLNAQTRSVSGNVVSVANGTPVTKATILVKQGSKYFAAADDGSFTLTIPSDTATIVVTAVGFTSKEFFIGKTDDNIVVRLDEKNNDLDEVVVVGYSDKKRSELTASIGVVKGDKLRDVTSNDVGTLLQGKVAGLEVINSSGVPGSAAEIRLRGISSVNASQTPLYVVDGIIGGNFDPNDVESISVLKDAAATAMYGSQANAGVIVVTTKKARSGNANFEAKITAGVRTPDYGSMDMMSGSQLYEYQKEFYRDYIPSDTGNSHKIDLLKFYAERPPELQNQNYSWLDAIFSPAFVQNYYVSVSGKTDKNDYYVGLSYYDENGTYRNTNFQRVNVRAGLGLHFSDKVSFTNSINISGVKGKSYDYNDIYYAYLNMPWDNPYDSTGNPIYVDGNSTFKWWSRDKVNPLHTIENSDHPYQGFDVNYDASLNVGINKWLSFSSTNRFAASYSKSTTYYSPTVAGEYHGSGFLDEQDIANYGATLNNLFKFTVPHGKHNITGLAGVAYETGRTEFLGGSGRGLPVGLKVLNVVSNNLSVSGSYDEGSILSFISQANYSYLNKYFLTASYRLDGSTAFPKSKRWGSFPAISAGWLASNEDFLAGNDVITNLKLRASYGVTGTEDIGASRYLGLYSLSTQYNSQPGAVPLQLPSPNLTWESKYQLNIGADVSFFDRVDVTVDVYHALTKDLLLQVAQPLSVGFEQRWENSGEIDNKGIELTIASTNIQTKNFSWVTNFNISFNSNKLKNLPATFVKTGEWAISEIYRNGGNLYEFFMPVYLGADPQTGAPLWEKILKDDQGNITGKEATSNYADATYQEVGSALPKYQGDFTNTFSYKNFALSVDAYFVHGNKVFSNILRFTINDGNEPYYNQVVLPDGYSIWTKPGDNATNPSPQNSASSTETSTRYLKDGSFVNLRNITLSYNLPQNVSKRLGMHNVRVAASADNVYTWTKFLGQDPQTTITPDIYATPGVSDFKYPNNRQFLLTLNLNF